MKQYTNKREKSRSFTTGKAISGIRDQEKAKRLIVDNRPAALVQRKLQEVADQACQAQRLGDYQEMLNHNLKGGSALQLQGLTKNASSRQENRTGMPDRLKTGIETLSGMDISDVRVHFNSSKPVQLNALAYAQGNEIHLGAGQTKHLPHEAWHVVQQRAGRVKPTTQHKGIAINDDPGLEQEATDMGERALQLKEGVGQTLVGAAESMITHGATQLQPEEGNSEIELCDLIAQLEQLISEAQRLSGNDEIAPGVGELDKRLTKLKAIAQGKDESAKAEALQTLRQEMSHDGLSDTPAKDESGSDQHENAGQSPLQKQPDSLTVQRLTGLEIGLLVGAVVGIGALAGGIYHYIKQRRAEAIFTEFGNSHRRRGYNPDVLGEEHNGIHQIQGQDQGARPEDAPAVNQYRISFHKLHSVKLYIEKKYPALYPRLATDFGIDVKAELLRISGAAKTASQDYKKRVKDMAANVPIAQLQQAYTLTIQGVGDQALQLAQRLQQIVNTETADSKNLDEIHSAGTDIWRDTWHSAVMAVNTVLHGRWPHWKGRLKRWTAQKRSEGLNYMDPNQIIGLDYIGSLAKGYKGPPKQAVRFMPEKFDVDANLSAPPLAAYALSVGGAMVDRGRIWSNRSGIAMLGEMEQDIQQHLENAGLIAMGMDPNEPFEAVIDAEGVQNLGQAPLAAVDKKAINERDQQLRDRIFWMRHHDLTVFRTIGIQLQQAGLATLDHSGRLTLREHDEQTQTYAYSPLELNQLERILQQNGA